MFLFKEFHIYVKHRVLFGETIARWYTSKLRSGYCRDLDLSRLLVGEGLKKQNCQNTLIPYQKFHTCSKLHCEETKSVIKFDDFYTSEKKDKKAFLKTIRNYTNNFINKRGHVDFIQSALTKMKEFGVHKDMDVYIELFNIFPKGPLVAKNKLQVGMLKFPRQLFCACDIVDQMSLNGVNPDKEVVELVEKIFGPGTLPVVAISELMYWSTKFKNKSPWELPKNITNDPFLLAEMAVKRMTSVDLLTEISIFKTDQVQEAIDKTWIVSGQSPKQKELLKNHAPPAPVIVEEGDIIWLRDQQVKYFMLKADCEPHIYKPPECLDDLSKAQTKYFNLDYQEETKVEPRSVHEQDDGIIYAICATGTSSKDSLLSWIRLLEKNGNPILNDLPVLFRFFESEKTPAIIPDLKNQNADSGQTL